MPKKVTEKKVSDWTAFWESSFDQTLEISDGNKKKVKFKEAERIEQIALR